DTCSWGEWPASWGPLAELVSHVGLRFTAIALGARQQILFFACLLYHDAHYSTCPVTIGR
ncbi:MAG: hypothetical protein ACKOBL_19930, partial [Chloroflexota bacterium]